MVKARERHLPELADRINCTACMACISSCRQGALNKTIGEDGHYYIAIDADKCVGCGMCEKACPIVNEIGVGENDLKKSIPYKGWSLDKEFKKRGTSGGVFGAISKRFIEDGGVVIGACLLDNKCRHIVMDKTEDIRLVQGSKYMYSDIEGIHKVLSSYLSHGTKVLFSGLPCQNAGVISFFRKNKNRHLLYTIDLVCGGMPSQLLKDSFSQKHPDNKIVSFRSKELYELRCLENGNERNYGNKNLLVSGFSSGLTNRYSCYACRYAYAHRCTDLTLGDYWQKEKSDSIGVSLMIVHNARGEELLSGAEIYKEATVWADFLKYNPKIVVGRTPWENRWERRLLGRVMRNSSYYLKNLIYASVYKKYDLIGIAYLVYKKIRYAIEHRRRVKVVCKILDNQ